MQHHTPVKSERNDHPQSVADPYLLKSFNGLHIQITQRPTSDEKSLYNLNIRY